MTQSFVVYECVNSENKSQANVWFSGVNISREIAIRVLFFLFLILINDLPLRYSRYGRVLICHTNDNYLFRSYFTCTFQVSSINCEL